MKKHLFLKSLLIAIGLLVTSINTAWAWDKNITTGQVFYFKPSEVWKSDNARFAVAFGHDDNTYYWYSCQPVEGVTDLYYVVSNGDYEWMIFDRRNPANNTNEWNSDSWNESQRVKPNSNYNRFDLKANWATDFNWYKYAPPMSSATLTNTATIYGGDGSSANPYQIATGGTLSVSASATPAVDGGYTKYYTFYKKDGAGSRTAWGSRSTTNTKGGFTVSSTAGTTYEVDVEAQNEYYSNYGTAKKSNTIYYVTIDPVYAILGTFNSWTHSASTWDLVDQGSNNWDASFLLKSGNHEFKVVFDNDYYGKGTSSTYYTITRDATSQTGLGTGKNNLKLTADYAGTYRFRYNTSGSVTITFPVKRQVNYSAVTIGSGTGQSAAPTAENDTDDDKAISNAGYVGDGNSVTFRAKTAKSGYTFQGWYSTSTPSAADWSSGRLTTSATYTVTVSGGNKTVYAVYSENKSDITLYEGSNGSISTPADISSAFSLGVSTKQAIVAVADPGYYFVNWTCTGVAAVDNATSASTYAKTNGTDASTGTITANFARRWVLAGDWAKDGSGNWVTTNDMNVSTAGGKTCAFRQVTDLAANTTYEFKLYDRTGATHWVGYASSGQVYDYETHDAVSPADSILVNSYPGNNISLKTAAQGDYYFYYNIYSHKLYVSFPASRKVEMGIYTQSDGVSSAYVGGTISAVDERDNVITNGLYIKSGDDITFTASPKAGYIWRGWYDNAYGYGDPVATERVHTDKNVTSVAFRRYAFFEEALYTVKVNRNDVIETSYKVGIDTHPTIMAATAPTGKIFDRWVTTGSATVADPYSSTTTITGATDDVSTVTATFKDLPKIYIDMTAATSWRPSNMYAYFYKGSCWDGDHGASATSNIIAGQYTMTKIDDTNIWYCSYDPTSGDFAGKTITGVAFSDQSQNSGTFWSSTVTYRNDFSSCMNMFVITDNSCTTYNNHSCGYRNTNAISGDAAKGYWRKYEEKNSGFYLNNLPGGSVEFTNEDGGNSYTAVANLDANTTYYFYLGGCNGWNWSNNNGTYPFNYDNPTRNLETYNNVSEDQYRCKLRTTAAGYYTFTLTPQNTRNVQVSVAFPVAANDYRAVYNNAASSPTISRPSNIIKSDQNSGTISLWLNSGTNYISFQKATVAGDGAVTWTSCGVQQTVTGVPEAGIYTMTLTKSNTTYTVSTPEKYEGGLYIRTDCAPGKWADYTENRLTENTFNFDPEDASTYDYYYCKWINDAGTNVRCVIANDINVAISDTLKTEATLGGGETLPEGANVRFSYNSVTNTLKRSYLTGASTDVFLNIMPDAASTVYKTDGTTDMYNGGVVGARNKFSDLGNWVYEMDVKVYPGATASVQANYNSTQQPLIAAGTTLLGGTEDVLYQIRLIYDFRTNYLMSAWMPNGDVAKPISLNSDMMIVRRAQNDANQLSFSGTGKLTDVKRAYGVFEFNKSEMVNSMSIWDEYTYQHCMYYFSLPFDVNVADIFGVGTMGDDWRIQFYNGTKRAEKGWFAGDGTTTFWEDVPADTVLHAYEGYCLMLNRSHFNNGSHAVWNNVTTDAYLYFPSVAPVAALKDNNMEITVPSHECKIDRFFVQDSILYYNKETKTWAKGARNHKYVDSHWNMMGTPLFEEKAASSLTACKVTVRDADSTLNYIYEWVPSTNTLSARQVLNTSFVFKPMYAYMVQYAGKVTFSGASITPAALAARRKSNDKQYTVELELTKESQFAGRTYVELRENAVDSFQLNEDMYMMKGSKIGDIYTHAGGYELAANVLTVNSHIVPVSVETKSAGTYTISMLNYFSGTVTLIDKFANTRTDLGIEDYEIYLEKGTISDRFELEININKMPTAIDGVEDGQGTLKDGKAHKYIENGQMYILQNGMIYDAQGKRVK